MSRRASSLLVLVLATFSLAAAACADSTGPQAAPRLSAEQTCDWTSSNTCRH